LELNVKILEDGEVIGLGEGETTKAGSEINGGWVMDMWVWVWVVGG